MGAVNHCRLHARLTPGKLVARDLSLDLTYTYCAFARAVGQFAAALMKRNVGPGERVALLARNRVECIIVHLACAQIGAIYVPLNWRLSTTEIGALIADAEPLLVIGDASLAASGLAGIPIDVFAAEALALAPVSDTPPGEDCPSLILYTSGTSGKPKGSLLTERNLDQTAINFSLLGRVNSESIFLCDAPMFHVIGLVTNIRPALMQGGALAISDGFVPLRTLDRLADQDLGITHYFCVPQMAAALRAESAFEPDRLRRLTAIFTGGAPHPAADILAWLNDGIPVVDGYGMSEVGTVFGMPLDPDLIAARAGSAGIPGPGIRSKIVDSDGRTCQPGQAGELLLQGENLTKGYWRRPEETAAAFTEDGWFRTGDIVRVDEDGYHWIVDRRKDMFISGGENVYPAEIESALAQFPGLLECAVIGVPDDKWGEVGHLFLVFRTGMQANADAICNHLDRHIARYKIPKHISLLASLPRNGAGKVLKTVLRQKLKQEVG